MISIFKMDFRLLRSTAPRQYDKFSGFFSHTCTLRDATTRILPLMLYYYDGERRPTALRYVKNSKLACFTVGNNEIDQSF